MRLTQNRGFDSFSEVPVDGPGREQFLCRDLAFETKIMSLTAYRGNSN